MIERAFNPFFRLRVNGAATAEIAFPGAPATPRGRAIRLLAMLSLGSALAACSDDDVAAPEPPSFSAACLDGEESPDSTAPILWRDDVVDLFTPAAASSLPADQQWRLSNFHDEYTLEVHLTHLADDAFLLPEVGRAFGIRISPSARVVATVDQVMVHEPVEEGEPRVISWSGALIGRSGNVSMSVGESGSAYGDLIVDPPPSRETAMYQIWALGDRLHAIACLDWTKFTGID